MLTAITSSLYVAAIPIPYPMKYVNILIDTQSKTLIDTGLDTPEAVAALEHALAEVGLTVGSLERVIITHHHPDHYGLAGWIQQRSNASVHMLDMDIARGERYWSLWSSWVVAHTQHLVSHGLPETSVSGMNAEALESKGRVHIAHDLQALQAGERVSLSGLDFEVLWMPGHSDGHLALWNEKESLLLAGDVILQRISPNIGAWAYSRPDPLGDYFGTLNALQELNPTTTVIGHYGPVLLDAQSRALELQRHHHERLDFCMQVLAVPHNSYQVSLAMFNRELNVSGRRFALAETLAHLEHLRLQGKVYRELKDDVWVYGV